MKQLGRDLMAVLITISASALFLGIVISPVLYVIRSYS